VSDARAGTVTPSQQARSQPGRSGGADQHSRLLRAILSVVGTHGYAGAKIGDIAAAACVSRATFYEHFPDKQACFNAAHAQLAQRAGGQIEADIGSADPARAAHAAIEAIAALAQREPDVLGFLTHEALLAGCRARAQHDELLARLAGAIERAWERAPQQQPAPDVPASMLLGGAVRLYCMRARRPDKQPADPLAGMLQWVDSYTTDQGSRNGRSLLASAACTSPSPTASIESASAARHISPRTLPRGRHRLPRDIVEAIQRERIAYATAEVVHEHDGSAIAVSQIVAAAGVSREVFYEHFSGKEQAFLATHQLIFEQLMAACSSAFFTPDTPWPERVWDAGRAFAGLLAANPSFAHFALVSSYGIGETGVRRIDETSLAFGLFLEEGYRLGPQTAALPRSVSDAVALAVVEAAACCVRNGHGSELGALVPAVAYTALAPFIGCEQAGELVDRMREREHPGSRGHAALSAPSQTP
jgi:AcrR family transcriptional regulator